MVEIAWGDGEAVPEPGGRRLAVREGDGRIRIVGGDDPQLAALPREAGPPRAIAWEGSNALLIVTGTLAVTPPYANGPSLLPIPPTGCTAQPFGSVPLRGMRLWRLPLDGSEAVCVVELSGVETLSRPVSLSGGQIAYSSYPVPAYGRAYIERVRYWDDAQGLAGPGKDLFPELPGTTSACAPSPDGRRLAFLHSDIVPSFPFWYRLAFSDTAPGSPVTYPLPADLRLGGRAPEWSPDGRHIAVTAFQGIRVGIVVVDARSGAWEWLGPTDGVYSRVALAPGGTEAIALWESPSTPRRLYRVGPTGRSPLSEADEVDTQDDADGVEVRLVRWRNGDVALEGALAIPPGAGPHPLVVDLHGGPINWAGFGYQENLLRWCRAGFAAFAPDYRESGIAGQEPMLAAHRAADVPPGLSSVEDVLAGVDEMVSTGIADPDRLHLFGHSAGGHLVNRIVTVDHRFRSAVCWEGLADVRLAFCLVGGGGGNAYSRAMLGGNPWQAPERYRALSPLARVQDVRTPILLLFGDHRGAPSPVADALVWYTALREHGVETELVIYRDEGHLLGRAENRDDLFARSTAWFRAHEHDGTRAADRR
jgi:dienelactone hydrolase